MEGFRDNIDNLAQTGKLESILTALIYWLIIVAAVFLVFLIAVKINNYLTKKNYENKKAFEEKRRIALERRKKEQA